MSSMQRASRTGKERSTPSSASGGPAQRYSLTRGCRHCPFRTDVEPYLRPERAQEIAQGILGGSEFPCHVTTVSRTDTDGEEQRVDAPGVSRVCGGALGVMVASESLNQMARIAHRFGDFDPDAVDTSKVYGSFTAFVDAYIDAADTPMATHPETGETAPMEHCGVVFDDCEDPAGYGGMGGAIPNAEPPTLNPFTDSCWACGSVACPACRSADWSDKSKSCAACIEDDWTPDEDEDDDDREEA